jgi:hypothetical protein
MASAALSLLVLVSCGKPQPAQHIEENPGLQAAETDRTRAVPRRLNPTILTNAYLIEDPAPVETNHPPSITCGGPQIIPCSPPEGAQVAITARVLDPDGDSLTVTWTVGESDLHMDQVAAGEHQTLADLVWTHTFTPGEYTIKVTVSDGALHASCTTTVTVQEDTTDPVVICPPNITVFPDPGQCTAVVNFSATASDDCLDVTVTYQPPPGSAFPIGVTAVTCTAVDAAGNTAVCQFDVIVQPGNRCPRGERFWQQNANAWPVASVILGNQTYTRTDALRLLRNPTTTDASVVLARQLIATTLNTALRSDPSPICGELAQAHALLSAYPGRIPFRVNPGTPAGESMLGLSRVLSSYNSGMLSPNCVP